MPHGSALPQPVRTVPNFLAALHRHILGLFSVYVSWLGYPRFIPLPASFGSLSGLILQWFWNVAPSLQWRDRAGFSPASILASCPAARSLQSAAQEEHKLSFVILFSLISIAQTGNKYNPLAMYNMQCAAKKLHIFAEIKQKRV